MREAANKTKQRLSLLPGKPVKPPSADRKQRLVSPDSCRHTKQPSDSQRSPPNAAVTDCRGKASAGLPAARLGPVVRWCSYSLAAVRAFLPSVLVLLSLLLRLRFMLLVALVRDMLGARRTNDSMRLASRDDKLGTLALELMGAPAAKRELTDSRALAAEQRGLWEGASLPDDSDTELTSGELTLTSPIEMAAAGSVPESLLLDSSPGAGVSVVSVPELDADPDPLSTTEDSTTMGSSCCTSELTLLPVPTATPWSSNKPSALFSRRRPPTPISPMEELRLMSEEEATLHTELLLPFLLDELAPPSDGAPPLSRQLFFTRLLHDCCCREAEVEEAEQDVVVVVPLLVTGITEGPTMEEGPETVDETGLGDGAVAADSGSYPGASFRSNFPSAPIR